MVKSNNDKPYHHSDFHNLRPYLDPGFPNNYPYSQYVNNKGELVFTPWRDSEYPKDYCYSQYVKEDGGKEDMIYELKKIEPLVLPTQYSSEESESDLEGVEENEDLMNHPDLLSPKLTLCSSLDRGGSGCDSDKMEPSLKESMYLINGSGSEIQLEGGSEIQSKSAEGLGMIIDNDDRKSSTLELGDYVCSSIGSCGPENVVSSEEDWIEKRWTKRVFYGEDGHLRHPYARMEKPNLNLMSCRYRCKSYRTFKCTARLDIVEINRNLGVDERRAWREHS